MYLDYFEGSYYINLDRRQDRRIKFEERVSKLDLFIPRYSAFEYKKEEITNPFNDPNWYIKLSCTKSHQNIIQIAKDNNWKNVWIFEDDCVFIEDFIEKAKLCINDLKQLDWDMFFFGGEPNSDCISITDNIVKTNGLYGTHCYAINSNFYDKILSIPFINGLIDVFYLNYSINDKKFYLSKKLLAWQDDELVSDLWGEKSGEQIYRNAYKKYIK
jgi:GR25 family glycosyltransferase involved in LPS biosynthesis